MLEVSQSNLEKVFTDVSDSLITLLPTYPPKNNCSIDVLLLNASAIINIPSSSISILLIESIFNVDLSDIKPDNDLIPAVENRL